MHRPQSNDYAPATSCSVLIGGSTIFGGSATVVSVNENECNAMFMAYVGVYKCLYIDNREKQGQTVRVHIYSVRVCVRARERLIGRVSVYVCMNVCVCVCVCVSVSVRELCVRE